MRVVAAIPVHGRHPLVRHTIRRLLRQSGVDMTVVCAGGAVDRAVCEDAGAVFVEHRNRPLGAKWQAAFTEARRHNPDAVLYCGSGDWYSANWCATLLEHALMQGHAVVGKRDYYYVNIGPRNVLRGVYWPSYPPDNGRRMYEAIGGGRLILRRALEAAKWQAFDPTWDHSMDWSLQEHVGWAVPVDDISICAADISTYRWGNKHSFEKLTDHLPHCEPLDGLTLARMVAMHFPELGEVFPDQGEVSFRGVSPLSHARQHRRHFDHLAMQCL